LTLGGGLLEHCALGSFELPPESVEVVVLRLPLPLTLLHFLLGMMGMRENKSVTWKKAPPRARKVSRNLW